MRSVWSSSNGRGFARLYYITAFTLIALTQAAFADGDNSLAGGTMHLHWLALGAVGAGILTVGIAVFWALGLSRRHRSRLRGYLRIIHNMPYGVAMFDRYGRLTASNKAYASIYRLDPNALRNGMTEGDLTALRSKAGTEFETPGGTESIPPLDLMERNERRLTDGRLIRMTRHETTDGGWLITNEDITARRALTAELRKTKAFLDSIVRHLPVGVTVKDARTGRYVLVNAAAAAVRNTPAEKFIGHTSAEIFGSAYAGIEERDREFLEKAAEPVREHAFDEAGERRIVRSLRVLMPGEESDRDYILAIIEDVTERRQVAHDLERTRSFLDTIIEHMPVAILVRSLATNTYVLANHTAEILFGQPRENIIGKATGELYTADQGAEAELRDRVLSTKPGMTTTDEVRIHAETPDGAMDRVAIARRLVTANESGEPEYVISALEDITERRAAEQLAAHLAANDYLTDLPNRETFKRVLEQHIARANVNRSGFGLVCVDLNGMKAINEVHSQSAGDAVMKEMANRLAQVMKGQFIARLDGDVFAVIVNSPLADEAERVTQAILEHAAMPFVWRGQALRIMATAGVAMFPADGETASMLHNNAAVATERAKSEARGAYRFSKPEIDQKLRDRRVLDQDLRRGIGEGQLRLQYQPIMRTEGKCVAFEALVRWQHPERGFIAPDVFVPMAEETGTVVALGEWVLREACREAAGWDESIHVGVNLSPVQFEGNRLVPLVHTVLLETGLSPGRLVLEITEGVLAHDTDHALGVLRRLKALGVRVALDDFGTGYSSLAYLQAFPFDSLKVDRSFVSNVFRSEQSASIVRAVIALAHSLGLRVVCEGVETADQLDFVTREKADLVQGYLLGRPKAIADYAEIVGHAPVLLEKAG